MLMAGSFAQFLVFWFGLGGGIGVPLGVPPGPEDPMMGQLAPAECIFYTTWSPTVAPVATNNPTERWMAQKEIQESFEKLKNAFRGYVQNTSGEERDFAVLGFKLAEKCTSNSVAIYLTKFEVDMAAGTAPEFEGGFVMDLGDEAQQLSQSINEVIDVYAGDESFDIDSVTIDDSEFRQINFEQAELKLTFTWGIINSKYFAFTMGQDEMKRLLANIKSPQPEWLSSLRKRLPVERVSSISYANIESLMKLTDDIPEPELVRFIELTNIKQVKRMGWVSGLDSKGFQMRTLIEIEGQPEGLLGLVNGDPLNLNDLDRIPDDKMIAFCTRLSPTSTYDFINEFSKMVPAGTTIEEQVTQLNEIAEFDFEEEVIGVLDDYVYIYGSVNPTNPTAGWVATLGAQNEMALSGPYDKIMDLINKSVEDYGGEVKEKSVGDAVMFTYEDDQGFGMPTPSWSFANGEIVLALDKSSIRRHLRRKAGAKDSLIKDEWFKSLFEPPAPDARGPIAVGTLDLAQILRLVVPLASTFGNEMFPDEFDFTFDDLPSIDVLTKDVKPNISAVYRTKDGFEMLQRQIYPGGTPGGLVGGAMIVGLPSTVAIRRSAARTASANQIRQLALAMHNYHDANRALPARFSKNAADKPLLSWRVHILPYLDERELYEEFHLDEPWDSEHNKKLIDRMPDAFKHPRLKLEDGKTAYVVPAGEDSGMIDPEKSADEVDMPTGVSLEQFTDGTSRTILVLEANEDHAVTWTKPEDYNWQDQMNILDGLKGVWPNGINMAFADASVHFMKTENLADKIKLLLQKSDGQHVDPWER